MKCEMFMNLRKPMIQQCVLLLTVFVMIGSQGCQSTQTVSSTSSTITAMAIDRPLPSQDIKIQEKHYRSNLPLGIGGSFDLFVADTASGVSDIYNSYVKPLRHGKIFRNRSYELDYAILPKNGSAFNNTKKKNLFGTFSMKSNYKFQVGMSRRFRDFSDFLNPGFWLALGRFAPSPTITKSTSDPLMSMPFEGEEETIEINPSDIYRIDLNDTVIYELE